MNIRSLLLASTFILAAATSAKAADAIIEQEPTPVAIAPAFSWAGGYVGGQIGYGWGKSEINHDATGSYKFKPSGFLGGLYAGYNFDLGNSVVLGIDGDATYNDLKDKLSKSLDGATVDLQSKLRWSGAVRARAGYAVDRFLPYIAGGVAFGSVKNSVYGHFDDFVIEAARNTTLTGWTAGAGIDYAATDNVILRVEYRYTDYGHKNFDIGMPSTNLRDKFKTNEIRLGVAYKF